MISHDMEISIARGVAEMEDGLTTVNFSFFLFFLNHMFIVPIVQEMTCILSIWLKQNRKSNNHKQKKNS